EPAAHELREEFPALVDAGEAREALVRSRVLLAPAWVDASVDLDLARGEDEPDPRVLARDRGHLLEARRREPVVRVQELHIRAAGEVDHAVLVPRLAEPDGVRLEADARVRVRPRDRDRRVGRGVVADDELEVDERLRERRLERLAQPPLGVVGGYADRYRRSRLQPGGGHAGTRSPSVSGLPSRSGAETPNRSSTVAGTSRTCPPRTVRPASTPGPMCQRRTFVVCSPDRRKWSSRAGFDTVPIRGEVTLVIGNSCRYLTRTSGRFGWYRSPKTSSERTASTTTGSPVSVSRRAASSRVRSVQIASYSSPGSTQPNGSRPRTFSLTAPTIPHRTQAAFVRGFSSGCVGVPDADLSRSRSGPRTTALIAVATGPGSLQPTRRTSSRAGRGCRAGAASRRRSSSCRASGARTRPSPGRARRGRARGCRRAWRRRS